MGASARAHVSPHVPELPVDTPRAPGRLPCSARPKAQMPGHPGTTLPLPWPLCPHRPVPGPRRWLGYLGLLLLDIAICLLVLVGLVRSSKGILVG